MSCFWKFESTTNRKMENLVGKEMAVGLPKRQDTGERVAFGFEPGNYKNWYFRSTRVLHVDVRNEDGDVTMDIWTKNSRYTFTRVAYNYTEEVGVNDEIVIVDDKYQLADWRMFRAGDRLKLFEMPFDKNGRHATGYAIWYISPENPTGYWVDEYEED